MDKMFYDDMDLPENMNFPEDMPEALKKRIIDSSKDPSVTQDAASFRSQESIISNFILEISTYLFIVRLSAIDAEEEDEAARNEILEYIARQEDIIEKTIEDASKTFVRIYFGDNDAHQFFPMLGLIKAIRDVSSKYVQTIESIKMLNTIFDEELDSEAEDE